MPSSGAKTPAVSILVPAYNEKDTIREVIERLLALKINQQVVVVNDGSTDGTDDILREFGDQIVFVDNPDPGGKGKAIRAGLPFCTGTAVIIQDADLEYLPEEIPAVTQPIVEGQSTVVYGSRFMQGMHPSMALPNKIVNVLLRWAVFVLFGKKLTDEATCYKAFRRDLLSQMNLTCQRFEFCPEVTAKSIVLGHQIMEVPISYEPRSKAAGKKIRWTDAPEAFFTLLKHRFWKPESQNEPSESSGHSKP
ncbi:glycosyltransferase family 2 protein [Kamptonema cortianum]|nr:glycosyltransferase family 2 protein [Geitlerinema splendidum]MDK3156262.1 glycosyltransferase family 2 protein [Kamptonema cortianum]